MTEDAAAEEQASAYLETVGRFLTVYRHVRQYSREMQSEGLSGRHVSALRYLAEAGPLTVGALGHYLLISDSSASELVDRLEAAGTVRRERSEADSRVVLVSLTPQGRKAAHDAPLGGIPLLRERLKALPAEDLARLDEALMLLARLLEIDGNR